MSRDEGLKEEVVIGTFFEIAKVLGSWIGELSRQIGNINGEISHIRNNSCMLPLIHADIIAIGKAQKTLSDQIQANEKLLLDITSRLTNMLHRYDNESANQFENNRATRLENASTMNKLEELNKEMEIYHDNMDTRLKLIQETLDKRNMLVIRKVRGLPIGEDEVINHE